jgi:hypothetical protein
MKKSELRQLIKEEISKILKEDNYQEIEVRPNLNAKFSKPFPKDFDIDQDIFEDFILDEDKNDIFFKLKNQIAEEENLDMDDESEEQEINELVWQEIYSAFGVPFKSHY